MTEAEQQQLIDDHFLFDKPVSPLLLASGMARDWPDARGIWCVRPNPPPAGPSTPPLRPRSGRVGRKREEPCSWERFGAAQASLQVTLSTQVCEGPWLIEASASRHLRGGGPVLLAFRLQTPRLGRRTLPFLFLAHFPLGL